MKPSTKRILSIAFAGLFFIAALVVYGNLIRPKMTEVNEKRALAFSKETFLRNQQSSVAQIQNLIGQMQGTEKARTSIGLAMPEGTNVTQALSQLNAIARDKQVEFLNFSVGQGNIRPKPSSGLLLRRVAEMDMGISVLGFYDNVKSFLEGVETNVRVSNVKKFSFAPLPKQGSGSTGGGLYSLGINLKMYYQE